MLALALALQAAASASAPPAAPAPAVSASCQVVNTAPAASKVAVLFAACGGRGVPIGPAYQYSASANANGSVLVTIKSAGRTRVWLASPASGGTGVLLEDMTRELARLGGRAGDLGLGDLPVDTSRFAADGSVGVVGSAGTKMLDTRPNAARAAVMPPVPAVTPVTGK